jgi:serine/threonine protein kinase
VHSKLGMRVGDYEIEGKLSQGGMAQVFIARSFPDSDGLGRRVVVKSLFEDRPADEKSVGMMMEEARLAAKLQHPNVIQILDLIESEGRPYIVMEHLDGQNLRQMLHRAATMKQRISLPVACRIIMDVLAGLGYAHAATTDEGHPMGLVHRDVSPANVLLTWTGNVKLIDFGVAKATQEADRGLTRCGEIKGKCAYMSPEQAKRIPLDRRSDLFAVGIMLWELLTVRRLFMRKTDFEALLAICRDDVPAPSTFNDEIPAELDRICKKALAREREDRYSSAEEMLADLQALVTEQGWVATRRSLRHELRDLFTENDDTAQMVQEIVVTPIARETAAPEAELHHHSDKLAIAQLAEAPATLCESWDDEARSYKAAGFRGGRWMAIAAACLLLGAAMAGLARELTSSTAAAAAFVHTQK